MSPRRRDVPAVLARHGIPPDADAATLLAAFEARGWEALVEEREEGGSRRLPVFRAFAFRRRPLLVTGGGSPWSHVHRQSSGRTAEGALRHVLAAVLEWEGRETSHVAVLPS